MASIVVVAVLVSLLLLHAGSARASLCHGPPTLVPIDGQDRREGVASAAVNALVRLHGRDHVCTGWFVGSQGHLLTAHHCVHGADTAAIVLEVHDGSIGRMYTGVDIVAASEALDYALIKSRDGTLRGRHYLVLHHDTTDLLGRSAIVLQFIDGTSPPSMSRDGPILTTTYTGCDRGGRLGYALSTKMCASGSPILSTATGAVLGLHTCGGCNTDQGRLNSGVAATDIIADLKMQQALPPAALAAVGPRAEVPPITTTVEVRGTLVHESGAPSVDTMLLSVATPGRLRIDVAAWTQDAHGRWSDVRGDCDGSYFDSKVILASVDTSDGRPRAFVLVENDDDSGKHGASDGSISARDAYVDYFIAAPGDYYVFVGTSGMALALKAPTASNSNSSALYGCGNVLAAAANYKVSLTADAGMLARVETPHARSTSPPCNLMAHGPMHCPSPRGEGAVELRLHAVVAGTLRRTTSATSTDHIRLNITSPGRIGIDVASYQEFANGSIAQRGLPTVCGRAYVDTILYVFERYPDALIAAVGTRPIAHVASERYRSISTRDPYLELELGVGVYTLVIGQEPLSLYEAFHALYPDVREANAPLLCGRPHPVGHYHVFFHVQHAHMLAPPAPPGSFDHASCTTEVCAYEKLP
ncbi:hypothetical protein SPRG_06079 [Saprolegnia parasitica CBS 223.65]|uniref:Peptidase S1 domain-containing protein n=1 Tax=Saprolegnia parasitica (strain CBS 223.65) TaxID=695850 RepID=A0A067CE36_SAPPC|nr:hypothetical protein SPRG_06079 [Saprolegnia parasitica CBS 223.65]KDO29024.1 hypothetical protein SPRG_06079 [Saprolegnia parasitica CBS 223.65]|eukprot:XP_012200194.1 hypothetical protein SPRG_06079 [Saprolegnia parasitica CBS 223.65]